MSGHTPGPWTVEDGHTQRDSGGIRYWQITDGQDAIACNQFCYAGSSPEVNAANARLIAAAPDLLAALEMMIADFADYPASERPCLAFDRARAAIARAKGPA